MKSRSSLEIQSNDVKWREMMKWRNEVKSWNQNLKCFIHSIDFKFFQNEIMIENTFIYLNLSHITLNFEEISKILWILERYFHEIVFLHDLLYLKTILISFSFISFHFTFSSLDTRYRISTIILMINYPSHKYFQFTNQKRTKIFHPKLPKSNKLQMWVFLWFFPK
jgi:hypothetical protein